MLKTRSRWLFLSLLVLIAVLTASVIAGCGEDTSATTATTASATTASTASVTTASTSSSTPATSTETSAPADTTVYEMGVQLMHSRPQPLVADVLVSFAKTVEERSGGRLKIEYFDNNSVAPFGQAAAAVEANTLQGAFLNPGWEPGVYPLTDLMGLPMLFPSCTVASLVSQRLVEEVPEWANQWSPKLKILSSHSTGLAQLLTVDKPVKTMEDLKGMKILCPAPSNIPYTNILGASPVTIQMTSPSDYYVTLQRDMAKAMWNPISPSWALKLGEIAKYCTVVDISLGPFVFVANKEWYDSLPEDLRTILDEETGRKLSAATGQRGLDEMDFKDGASLKEQGMQFYVLPEEERARWRAAFAPITVDLIKQLTDKGYNAQAVYDEMLKLIDEVVAEGAYIPDRSALAQ